MGFQDRLDFLDPTAVDRFLPAVQTQEPGDVGVGFALGPLLVAGVTVNLRLDDDREQLGPDLVREGNLEPHLHLGARIEGAALLDGDRPPDSLRVAQLLPAIAPQQLGGTLVADPIRQRGVEVLTTALEPVQQLHRGNVKDLDLADRRHGGKEVLRYGSGSVSHGGQRRRRGRRDTMSTRDTLTDAKLKSMNALHRTVLKLSGGRLMANPLGMPTVELATTGRKTGRRRATLLTAPVHDDDRVVLVASKGGDDRNPEWYLNLVANPDVELTIAGTTTPMRARTASAEEKTELWPRIVAANKGYGNYQQRTDRDIPVVIFEPRSAGEV